MKEEKEERRRKETEKVDGGEREFELSNRVQFVRGGILGKFQMSTYLSG